MAYNAIKSIIIRFVKDNSHNGKISLQAVEDYVRQFAGSELFRGFLDKMNAEEVMKMTNYEFDLDEAKEAWKEEAILFQNKVDI